MKSRQQIHRGKPTFRRHYLREWLEEREMEPMDLVNVLNEAEPERPLDKTHVYRWLRGTLPHIETQIRIAAALELRDPETGEPNPELMMTHPAQVWIARKVQGRPKEDVERLRQMIELAFPDRTGTDN